MTEDKCTYKYIGDGVTARVDPHRGIILQTCDGTKNVIYLDLQMLDTIVEMVANATERPQP